MKIVYGDLLKMGERGEFDVIIHDCNCVCIPDTELGKRIMAKYPSVQTADFSAPKADGSKPGTYSVAKVSDALTVINAYVRFNNGNKVICFQTLEKLCHAINIDPILKDKRIGIALSNTNVDDFNLLTAMGIISDKLQLHDITLVDPRVNETVHYTEHVRKMFPNIQF